MSGPGREAEGRPGRPPGRPVGTPPAAESGYALAELVSRVVERGVVLSGDLVISVAGVDLLYVGLDVLLAAADRLEGPRLGEGRRADGPPEPEGGDRG